MMRRNFLALVVWLGSSGTGMVALCQEPGGCKPLQDVTALLQHQTVVEHRQLAEKPAYATQLKGTLTVIPKMGFGPEVEFQGIRLGSATPESQKIPDAGELAQTKEKSSGTSYPVLALHIDHLPTPYTPIVEAVFGPVAGTKEGISWLIDATNHIHDEIDTIKTAKPLEEVVQDISQKVFKKGDELQASDGIGVNLPVKDWTATAADTNKAAHKTYTQINMQVALNRVVDVYKVTSRLDSRIVNYAAVQVAKKLTAGNLNCPEFHGFFAQFLVYTWFRDADHPDKGRYGSQIKNLPGVLIKANLQEILIGTMLQGKSQWAGPKKVTIPTGPVKPDDVKDWAEKQGKDLEHIVDEMFTLIEKLVSGGEEERQKLPELFDEQHSISWVRALTKARLGKEDPAPAEKWMWKRDGMMSLKQMVTTTRDASKEAVMKSVTEAWHNVFVKGQECNAEGQSKNARSDTFAGAPVSPFFLSQTNKLCVIGETRTDSNEQKDLTMVMIDEPEEFLSLLLYMAGA